MLCDYFDLNLSKMGTKGLRHMGIKLDKAVEYAPEIKCCHLHQF
jgi:hypothetical protein